MLGKRTNLNSYAEGAKVFDPVGIPLIGCIRYQAINLVLQAGKDLGGGPSEAKKS